MHTMRSFQTDQLEPCPTPLGYNASLGLLGRLMVFFRPTRIFRLATLTLAPYAHLEAVGDQGSYAAGNEVSNLTPNVMPLRKVERPYQGVTWKRRDRSKVWIYYAESNCVRRVPHLAGTRSQSGPYHYTALSGAINRGYTPGNLRCFLFQAMSVSIVPFAIRMLSNHDCIHDSMPTNYLSYRLR